MSEWISVKDRLPVPVPPNLCADDVLLYGDFEVWRGYLDGYGRWIRYSEFEEDEEECFPTHWIPLPNPSEVKDA